MPNELTLCHKSARESPIMPWLEYMMMRAFCPSIRTRRIGLQVSVFFEVFFELPWSVGVGAFLSKAGMLRAASQDFVSPLRAFFWGGAMVASIRMSEYG